MNWIKFSDRMPNSDITVLTWREDGAVAFGCCINNKIYDAETLMPIHPQYWCEIIPPNINL